MSGAYKRHKGVLNLRGLLVLTVVNVLLPFEDNANSRSHSRFTKKWLTTLGSIKIISCFPFMVL